MTHTSFTTVGYKDTGKTHNCQIVALAALTGLDYLACENAFWADLQRMKLVNIPRSRWSGKTALSSNNRRQLVKVGADLGVEIKTMYPRRQQLRTLVKRLDPSKVYAVGVTNHYVTVHNGWVFDQNGVRHISADWKSHRKMVDSLHWVGG